MTLVRPRLPGRLVDRYLLREMLRPLILSLVFVLAALLTERILRLVDFIATQGGPLGPVLTMAASLLPHYLGLALPAAFFLSILVVVGRLSQDSEVDVLMSSGLSLRRIAVPFLCIGVILALFSLALFGYLQPYTRYGYRAALHAVTHGAWSGEVPGGMFVDAGEGITFHAVRADRSGRLLWGVFIEQRRPGGVTVTITARQGRLLNDPEQDDRVILILSDGSQLRTTPDGASLLRFDRLTLDRTLALDAVLFRPRGGDERELTLGELWSSARAGAGPVPPDVLRAELHGRLVRAASVVVLPLLALPMGLASKRGRRGVGMVLAALILVLYHHTLQVGEGLVEVGHLAPAVAVWLPFAVFSAFAGWALLRVDGRPGRGPFDGILVSIEQSLDNARRWAGGRRGRSL